MCASLIGSPSAILKFLISNSVGTDPMIRVVVLSPPNVNVPDSSNPGATATMEGAAMGSFSAAASAKVSGRSLLVLACWLGPPSCILPLKTNKRLVPIFVMEPVMDSSAPFPTASMAMTAATPITMPRTVNPDRILFPARLSRASRNA